MARHDTRNGQKICTNRSPLKSAVHKGHTFLCSTVTTQIARRRCRRISTSQHHKTRRDRFFLHLCRRPQSLAKPALPTSGTRWGPALATLTAVESEEYTYDAP